MVTDGLIERPAQDLDADVGTDDVAEVVRAGEPGLGVGALGVGLGELTAAREGGDV